MATVRYAAGGESKERLDAMKAEVMEAAKRPYAHDPDCPLLTEEQLAEFRPANYATGEERLAAMKRGECSADAFASEFCSAKLHA